MNIWGYPFTPMSDQDRISPHNINTISIRQVMRIKKNISLRIFELIQYQISRSSNLSNLWQTVKRITNEILDSKGTCPISRFQRDIVQTIQLQIVPRIQI